MPGRWLSGAEKLYKTMGLKLQGQARRLAPAEPLPPGRDRGSFQPIRVAREATEAL